MGAIEYWATSQWAAFAEAFHLNFIKAGRWHYLVDGLWVTLLVAFFAVLIGAVLGFLVAFIVSYNGHAWLTFSATQARGWPTVARFFAVACLGFVANETLYAFALHGLHWHYFWSLAGVLVLVAAGTFVLSKFWAFKARTA